MKKSTKTLLISLCAVLLVAASVMGTLAYLTSTATVTNTFTIGAVKISLDETNVDVDGKPVNGEQAGRVEENSYKLMPGHTYTKDPIVHVDANSEPCYVFVEVINEITAIEAAGDDSYTTVAAQMAANGWTALDGNNGVYYYNENGTAIYTPGEDNDLEVFANFKVDGDATNDDLTALMGDSEGKTITITAYAIQADGFDTVADAWAASGFGAGATD